MDRKIEKQRLKLNKVLIIGALSLVTACGVYNLFFSDLSTPTVDKSKIRIGVVKRGTLDILVSGNGVVTAKDPEWVVAKVPGQVVKCAFKAGDPIKKGDLLVELVNEDIISAFSKSESELRAAKADFSALKISLESQRNDYESALKKAELDSKQAEAYYNAVKKLWEKGSPPVSEIEYVNTRLKAEQMRGLAETAQNKLKSFKNIEAAQISAFKFRLASYEEENARIKGRVNDLKIRANIDGILQNLNLKDGQAVVAGDQIAQVINPKSTYVTLNTPAIQAFKLSTQQKVNIELNRKSVSGVVHRIDPNVKGTTVDVDVYFNEDVDDAKIGMFVNGTVFTQQISDTLYVEIPSQAAENSNLSVFILSPDRAYANLTHVKSGALSSNYLQIIDGLKEGDNIILSDLPTSTSTNKIRLN